MERPELSGEDEDRLLDDRSLRMPERCLIDEDFYARFSVFGEKRDLYEAPTSPIMPQSSTSTTTTTTRSSLTPTSPSLLSARSEPLKRTLSDSIADSTAKSSTTTPTPLAKKPRATERIDLIDVIQSSITPIPSSRAVNPKIGSPALSSSGSMIPTQPQKSISTATASQTPTQQRFSSFTQQEHALFLDLERKYLLHQQQQIQRQLQPQKQEKEIRYLDDEGIRKYLEMQQLVFLEQQEYDNAQRQKAREMNVFLKYNPAIKARVEEILSHKRQRVRQYPRFYQPQERFELNKVAPIQPDDPVLQHNASLFQIGRILHFDPPADRQTEIPLDMPVFQANKAPKTRWHKQTMPVVSEDPYVRRLVQSTEQDVEIVMSSGSVSALLMMYFESWEIPVSIVQDESTGGKKVVMLDKPLLKKKMTLREKNELYYKTAYEYIGLSLAPERSIHLPFPAKSSTGEPQAKPKTPPAQGQTQEVTEKKKDQPSQDEEAELKIDEDVDEEQNEETSKSEETNANEEEETKKRAQEAQERHRLEREMQKMEALKKAGEEWMARSLPSLADDNLTYDLWRIGDLSIMIRSKLHGYIKTPEGNRYIGTKVKLEYFGDKWEEITLSETGRQWAHYFIRPFVSVILFARINIFSSLVLCTERRDAARILPGTAFDAARAVKALSTLLRRLRELPPGQFLLSHKVEEHAVVILKAIDSSSAQKSPQCYDLHTSHASSGATDERTVPYVRLMWPPELWNQIPHTFSPRPAPGALFSPSALSGTIPWKIINQLKKVKNVKYCHGYAKKGCCRRAEACPFPHIDAEEVLRISKEAKKKANKKRKEKIRAQRRQSREGGGDALTTPAPSDGGGGNGEEAAHAMEESFSDGSDGKDSLHDDEDDDEDGGDEDHESLYVEDEADDDDEGGGGGGQAGDDLAYIAAQL